MNRNDVVLPAVTATTGDNNSSKKTPIVSPRQSPRLFDASSFKRSPRQQPPKSAGSTTSRPTFPKGALLEEKSVHLPMPSFHERHHGTLMGWECAGCGSVNQSALSNECSVCGMLRSVDFDSNNDVSETMAGDDDDEDVSFSSMLDGNASEASLSHFNCSILDHKQPEMVQQRGHMSLPVLQSSFSSLASQRTTRTAWQRPGRSRSAVVPGSSSAAMHDDDSSSVVSFRHWNGNHTVKPWECGACTFINDNPLQHVVVCEMCGHRRDAAHTTAAAAHIPLDQSTTEEEEDAELELLRTEQIRELIEIQRDIMSNFGTRHNSSLSSNSINHHNNHAEESSKFNTSDLQREIAELQPTPRLDYNDIDGTEYYELERIKEVVKAQQEIMMDFKRKRVDPDRDDRKVASSLLLSPSSQKASASADSLFGVSNHQPNTTPNHYLKGKAPPRGMLRQEDLILPILWGDDLGKAEKKSSGSSVTSRNSGAKR